MGACRLIPKRASDDDLNYRALAVNSLIEAHRSRPRIVVFGSGANRLISVKRDHPQLDRSVASLP
jgi:hypothetical protein